MNKKLDKKQKKTALKYENYYARLENTLIGLTKANTQIQFPLDSAFSSGLYFIIHNSFI